MFFKNHNQLKTRVDPENMSLRIIKTIFPSTKFKIHLKKRRIDSFVFKIKYSSKRHLKIKSTKSHKNLTIVILNIMKYLLSCRNWNILTWINWKHKLDSSTIFRKSKRNNLVLSKESNSGLIFCWDKGNGKPKSK